MRSTLCPRTLVSEIQRLPSRVTSSTIASWSAASCCGLRPADLSRKVTIGSIGGTASSKSSEAFTQSAKLFEQA